MRKERTIEMSNETVIRRFLEQQTGHTATRNITDGVYTYQGQTLARDGLKLVNYSTVIARHISNNVVEINVKKYSVTTKIQNKLKQLTKEYGYDVVEVIGE